MRTPITIPKSYFSILNDFVNTVNYYTILPSTKNLKIIKRRIKKSQSNSSVDFNLYEVDDRFLIKYELTITLYTLIKDKKPVTYGIFFNDLKDLKFLKSSIEKFKEQVISENKYEFLEKFKIS